MSELYYDLGRPGWEPNGSQRTGGALSIVEHPFPVGALVPPHTHTREDEFSS